MATPKKIAAVKAEREVELIVIHCAATRVDRDYSVDQMERDHRARGFRSAGYHFYIPKSGNRIALRSLEMVGAHVTGFNAKSIGICYEGGLDTNGKAADTRTTQQKETLSALLKELRLRYPKARILGHRDLSPDLNGDGKITRNEWTKMCPCFDAEVEYKNI